jgi:hypothetical protein
MGAQSTDTALYAADLQPPCTLTASLTVVDESYFVTVPGQQRKDCTSTDAVCLWLSTIMWPVCCCAAYPPAYQYPPPPRKSRCVWPITRMLPHSHARLLCCVHAVWLYGLSSSHLQCRAACSQEVCVLRACFMQRSQVLLLPSLACTDHNVLSRQKYEEVQRGQGAGCVGAQPFAAMCLSSRHVHKEGRWQSGSSTGAILASHSYYS